MGWKIDRDYINTSAEDREFNRVGLTYGTVEGETFRFRLLDDDGIVYFGGKYDAAAAVTQDGDEVEALYDAWTWGMNDAGAVDLQVRVVDGIAHGLTSRRYADQLGLKDSDWVSVYA